MNIILAFAPSISGTCRMKIQAFGRNVLSQGLTKDKPPFISYPGMNKDTQKGLSELRKDYDEQHQG